MQAALAGPVRRDRGGAAGAGTQRARRRGGGTRQACGAAPRSACAALKL